MIHASPASPTLARWLTGPRVAGLPAPLSEGPAPLLSFEFFPPRTEALEAQLWTCIRRLEVLRPHFVSVTYGAGGSTQARTHATVARILAETSLTPAAHLTCVGATRVEVDAVARRYWDAGVRHIVALRGDPPPGEALRAAPGRLRLRRRSGGRSARASPRSRSRSPPIPRRIRRRSARRPTSTT